LHAYSVLSSIRKELSRIFVAIGTEVIPESAAMAGQPPAYLLLAVIWNGGGQGCWPDGGMIR
jgi:hypothetical protein